MLHCRVISAALFSGALILSAASARAQDAQRTPPSGSATETPARPAAEIREADRPVTTHPGESATHSGGPVERAGQAVDEVVDKTGKVVKKVVVKTKEGVKTVVEKTGQTVRKAGEKIEEIAAPNKP